MAWCPKCMNEYQDGYTQCSDCGETLVSYEEALEYNRRKKAEEEEADSNLWEDAVPEQMTEDEPEQAGRETVGGPVTFTRSADRYKENLSAGYMFIVVGILCAAFEGYALIKKLPFLRGNYLTISVIAILAAGCIIIGIVSLLHAKKMKADIGVEEKTDTAVREWLNQNITEEILSEIGKDKEPEELRYFDRIAYMKERLSEEFGEMNDAYLDQVCDDYYNENME